MRRSPLILLSLLTCCVVHTNCLAGVGSVLDVSPWQGSAAGGTEMHIAGTGFADVEKVLMGGQECAIFRPSVKDGEMFCYSPPDTSREPGVKSVEIELVWNSGFRAKYKKGTGNFWYSSHLTPSIRNVDTPAMGVLDNVTFTGYLKESLMGGQDFMMNLLGEKRNATRVMHAYLGSGLHVMSDKGGEGEYRCDIIDTPSGESTGICEVKAGMPAGFYNFSYVLSKMGESWELPIAHGKGFRSPHPSRVSMGGQIHDVEVFPTVHSLTGTPKVGILGGTEVDLEADGLDVLLRPNSEHTVMLAGVPCAITSSKRVNNDDFLTCTTGPVSSRESSYPSQTSQKTWESQTEPVVSYAPHRYEFPGLSKRTFQMSSNVELVHPLQKCTTSGDAAINTPFLDAVPQYSLEKCAEICFRVGVCKFFYHSSDLGHCRMCEMNAEEDDVVSSTDNVKEGGRRRWATWEPAFRDGGIYKLKTTGRAYIEANSEGPTWKLVSSFQRCKGTTWTLNTNSNAGGSWTGLHGADVQTCADQCAMYYVDRTNRIPCKYFGVYHERNTNQWPTDERQDYNKVRCLIYTTQTCELETYADNTFFGQDQYTVYEISKPKPSFPQLSGFYPGGRGIFYRVWNPCPADRLYLNDADCWTAWWDPSPYPFAALYAGANSEYALQTPMFEGVRADALMGPFGKPLARDNVLTKMEAYDSSVPYPTLDKASSTHGLIFELLAFFVPPFTATYSFFTWGGNLQDIWLAQSTDQTDMVKVAESLLGQPCGSTETWWGGADSFLGCSVFYESVNGQVMKGSLRTPSLQTMQLNKNEKRFLVKRVSVPAMTYGPAASLPTDYEGSAIRIHKPDLSSLSAEAKAALGKYQAWPEIVRFQKSGTSGTGFFKFGITIGGQTTYSSPVSISLNKDELMKAFNSLVLPNGETCLAEVWGTGTGSSVIFIIWKPGGDLEQIKLDTSTIQGDITIEVDTITDGDSEDLFIYPLTGTFLEVPATVPQVQLSTIGITARNGNLQSGSVTGKVATPSAPATTSFDYTNFDYSMPASFLPTCSLNPPDVSYRYLRWRILELGNHPGMPVVWCEISELYIWGPDSENVHEAKLIDLKAATITASVNNVGGSGTAQLVDGNVDTQFKAGGSSLRGAATELVFDIDLGAGNGVFPLMFAYATGSSDWQIDPQKWVFMGSNDATTWTDLHDQTAWPHDRIPHNDRKKVVFAVETDYSVKCSDTGVGLQCGWGYTFPGAAATGLYGDLDDPQVYETWAECQQRCCDDERCKAATWDSSSKHCKKFSRFFEISYDVVPMATSVVANLQSRKDAPDDGWAVTERVVKHEGETVSEFSGHRSVTFCKKMCNAAAACHSFTWSEASGCTLKKLCVDSSTQLVESTDSQRDSVTYYQVHPKDCAAASATSGPSTTPSLLRYGASGTGGTSFQFEYLSSDESPSIQELLVNGVASTAVSEGDTIAIKGSNFDLQGGAGELAVYIGTIKCPISAASDTDISCVATANTHKKLNVKVMVGWKGWADFGPLLKPTDGQPRGQMSITFGGGVNEVTEIKPASGSMLGGTRIKIKGKGFDTVSSLNTVLLGTVPCSMRAVTTSQIECVTPSQGFVGTSVTLVSVNGVTTFKTGGDVKFTYDEAVSPQVQAISPSSLSFAVTSSVTISGQKLGLLPSYVTVKFGDRTCRVLSASDTSISCQLTRTTVTDPSSAVLAPTVMITGVGYAKIESSVALDTSFAIHSVSPSVGSSMGGCEVTVTGIGFSSSAVTSQRYIAVMGTYGDVISWSPTKIVFTTRKAVSSVSEIEVNVNLIKALHLCNGGSAGPCKHDVFTQDYTPSITSLSTNSGRAGDKLKAVVALPSGYISSLQAADVTISLGANVCTLDAGSLAKSGDSLTVECTVPEFEASAVEVQVLVKPLGYSKFAAGVTTSFNQRLIIDSITPNEGSMAGRDVVLKGAGFSTSPMRHFVRVGDEYGICEPTSSSYSELACTINYRRFVPAALSSLNAKAMAQYAVAYYCEKREENVLKIFPAPFENTTGWTSARDACESYCLSEAQCTACSYFWYNWEVYQWRALKECGEVIAGHGPWGKLPGDVSVKVFPKEVSQAFTRYSPGWICADRLAYEKIFWSATDTAKHQEQARDMCEDYCMKTASCWGCTIECWYTQCWFKALSQCPSKVWNYFEQVIDGGLTEKTLVKTADVDLTLWSTEVSSAPLTAFAGRQIGCMQENDDWTTWECISEEECGLRCLTQVGCASFEFTARYQKCVLSKTSFSTCSDCLEADQDDCVYYEKKTTASSASVSQGYTYKFALTPKIDEVWTVASGSQIAGVQTTDTGCGQSSAGYCCASPHEACSWGEGLCADDSQCAGSLSCMQYACSWAPLSPATDLLAVQAAYDQSTAPVGYGCFYDSTVRDLPDVASNDPGWSVADCAVACKGYLYFGMQSNGYCLCGQSFGMHGRATDCPSCAIDAPDYGAYRNCVFENGVVEPWATISSTAACGGDALETLTATHLECKTKCVKSPTCQAIDYYSATSQCMLHTSACTTATVQSNGASSEKITLARWNLYIPPSSGTKACGGTAAETLTDSTKEACEARCLETTSCAGFDWFSETNVCSILATLCDTPELVQDGGSAYKLAVWVRKWEERDEKKAALESASSPPQSCCVAQGNNEGFISTDVSRSGDEIVLRMPAPNDGDIAVSFSGVPCPIKKKNSGNGLVDITCELGEVPGGLKHHALVEVAGYGKAFDAYNWVSTPLTVGAVSAVGHPHLHDQSLGGGWHLKISGQGFAPPPSAGASAYVEAMICGRKCDVITSTYSELTCVAPKVYTPELYASGTDFGLQLPLTRVVSNNAGLPDAEAPQCFSGNTDEMVIGSSECISIFDQETEVLGGISGSGCQFGLDFGEFTSVRIEQIRFFPPFDTYTAANYINGKWQVGELDEVEHAKGNELAYGWHGTEYQGRQNVTKEGAFCERWDVAMPELLTYHPELAGHSFCRNPLPTQWDHIWCVTKGGQKQTCNRKPPPIVWTTVSVVEKAPKMLWNSHSMSEPLVTRFVRFQNPAGDCRMNEVQVIGNLVSQTSTCAVAVRNVRQMSGTLTPLDLSRPGYGSFLSPMTDWATSSANPVTLSAFETPYVASIEPMNGTARGGTTVTLIGSQFGTSWSKSSGTDSPVTVTFSGYNCDVTSVTETVIQCVTGARDKGINPQSTVIHIAGVGNALIHPLVLFRYLDPWSESTTWADQEPPFDGDMVIVPPGQAIAVDVDTPILNSLIVEGVLVFDDTKDVHLQAHYIWVKGGTFEIGNEQRPYLHRALVTLHGNKFDAVRLPVVGAKCLAVSNEKFTIRDGGDGAPEEGRIGTLDIHGAPRKKVWTTLTDTVNPGDTVVKVKDQVDFVAGEVILITSTKTPAKHFEIEEGMFGSPPVDFEDEELIVSMVDTDMKTIHLTTPVKHKHISTSFKRPDGEVIDLSGEVALLSRNVKIQGDASSEEHNWGGHTMNAFGGVYRIENAEFYRMGQTAELSRYPIHFHVARDWGKQGYVKHNSIHNSYQRAVTIHATDYVVVEGNVGFKTMGHMFFVETGMEKYNLFQGNLAVGAIPLLSGVVESDMEPSGFWTATPQNFWRDNVAVTGSDGWYFQLPAAPLFHSQSVYGRSICPQGEHLGEASGNRCHHISGTCMRVYHIWKPTKDPCNADSGPAPQILYNTVCWGNGFMCFNAMFGGALHNHHMTSIEVENIDVWMEQHHPSTWTGIASVKDSVFVGILPENLNANSLQKWKASVIEMPQDENFLIENCHFINYLKVPVFQDCSGCYNNGKWKQGAYTYHFSGLTFHNSSKRLLVYKKGIYHDGDGSLVGKANSYTSWADAFNMVEPACSTVAGPLSTIQDQPAWAELGTVHDTGNRADPTDSIFHIIPPSSGAIFHERRNYKFITCDRPIRLFAVVDPDSEVALQPLKIKNVVTGAVQTYDFEDKGEVGWVFPVLSNSRYEVQPNLSGKDITSSSLRYSEADYFQLKTNQATKMKRQPEPEWVQMIVQSDSAWDHYQLLNPDAIQVGSWVKEQKLVQDVPYLHDPTPLQDPASLPSMAHGMMDSKNWAVNFRFPAANSYNLALKTEPNTARFEADRCPVLGCAPPVAPVLLSGLVKESWITKFGNALTNQQDIVIESNQWIEFDSVPAVEIKSLVVKGKLTFSDAETRYLETGSIIVYGIMEVGSAAAPFGATTGKSASIVLTGAFSEDNYLEIGEHELYGKSIAVVGHLQAHGAVIDNTWGTLDATVNSGASSACVRGVTGWPAGAKIAISPTDFDNPAGDVESSTVSSAAAGSGCWNMGITAPLQKTHYAGDIDIGNSKTTSLRSVVARVDRTVIFTTGTKAADTADTSYGGHIEVVNLPDTSPPLAGTLDMKYVKFDKLGKGGLRAAVKIEYSSGFDPVPTNTFEGCAWTDSVNYALHAVSASTPLLVTKNVFVNTASGGIWTEFGSSKVQIVQNAILGVYLSPKAPRSTNSQNGGTRVMNYAGIRADTAPSRMNGNVVAGSNDMGYMLPMEDCSTMTAFDNEATATIVGLFLLSRSTGNCQAANLYKVWKAAHIGVYLADVSISTRLNSITVSDCHEGIVPYFTLDTGYRRLWVNDAVIIGSSPLSSCAASVKCRAQTEMDPYMADCNSVFEKTNFRRVGFLAVINSMNSKTCTWDKTFCRLVSPAYVYLACQFPFEATYFMDKGMGWAHFKRTTFAYWKEDDCSQTSRAISMNPLAAEIQWPTSFEETTWHASDDVAKFELSATGLTGAFKGTSTPCSDTGSGCMGLDQMILQDLDGTLMGMPYTKSGSVLPLTPRTESTWRSMCETKLGPQDNLKLVDAMVCGNITTQLLEMNNLDLGARDIKFGPLVLTPNGAEDNGFEGGASSSVGPFYAQCPCGWDFSFYHVLIKPSTSYYAEVMSFPGNFKLQYWSASPSDSVLLEFYYPRSEGLSVFVGSTDYQVMAISSKPTLADAHGTYMVDTQEQRFYLVMRGSPEAFKGQKDIVVKKTPTVQLSANVQISIAEFNGPQFRMNLAILLGIPPERIKLVDVQRRRRLTAGDPESIKLDIDILPSADAAASAAGGDASSTSQGSLDAQAAELEIVSSQLQASLSLPDFAAAAGGPTTVDSYAAPSQQDQTKAVETPSSETDQPAEADVTALASSRAAQPVSPTAPCPAQTIGVSISGMSAMAALTAELASGASTSATCASAVAGYQGNIVLACVAGTLTADPSGCIPSGCSQSTQVTIGWETATVGPSSTIASGLIVTAPCSNIDSKFTGSYLMSCNNGVLSVDANACATGCPTTMSLTLLVADRAKTWSPSSSMSSGGAADESCASINSNYEGVLKIYCYYGVLSSDPSGCSPKGCEAGLEFDAVVAGQAAKIAMPTTMSAGQTTTMDCGLVNAAYGGNLKVRCWMGVMTNDELCALVCPASMSLAVTLGGVTNSVSPRSQIASGEDQRFDCSAVNPTMQSTFYMKCMDGQLSASTNQCVGRSCSTSLTAQVTLGGETGTISPPYELTHGESFQVACSDINVASAGVITALCYQEAIQITKECQEGCLASDTVQVTVGGETFDMSPTAGVVHGGVVSVACPGGTIGNVNLACTHGVLSVMQPLTCEVSTTSMKGPDSGEDNSCGEDFSASECEDSCDTTDTASVIIDGASQDFSPTTRMKSGDNQGVPCVVGMAILQCFKGVVSVSNLDTCRLQTETSTTKNALPSDGCASEANSGPSWVANVGQWTKAIYAQKDLASGETEDRSCTHFGTEYQGTFTLTCNAGTLNGDVSDCTRVSVEDRAGTASGSSSLAVILMLMSTGLYASLRA